MYYGGQNSAIRGDIIITLTFNLEIYFYIFGCENWPTLENYWSGFGVILQDNVS